MILIIYWSDTFIGLGSITSPLESDTDAGMLVLDVPVTVWEWVAFTDIAYVFCIVPAIFWAYVANFTSYALSPASPPPMSIFKSRPVLGYTINGA